MRKLPAVLFISTLLSIPFQPSLRASAGLPPGWDNSTVLIEKVRPQGKDCSGRDVKEEESYLPKYCPYATGFLIEICNQSLLVSNRHVFVETPGSLFVRFRKIAGGHGHFPVGITWRAHPNHLVDVAASTIQIPEGLSLDDFDFVFFDEDHDRMAESPASFLMKFEDVRPGDDVVFLGFPGSIPEVSQILRERSIPFLRFGIVSLKLEGTTQFRKVQTRDVLIVDTWAFGGNSGSPVFSRPRVARYRGDRPHIKLERPYIIGVVSAVIPQTGLTIVQSADAIEQTAAQFPDAKCPPPLPAKQD